MTGKTEENKKVQQEVPKGLYGPRKWLLKESQAPQSGAKACGGWCQTAPGGAVLCHLGHRIKLECSEPFAQKTLYYGSFPDCETSHRQKCLVWFFFYI